MLRRTHADQLFGRPILKLKALQSKTIAVEFNTVERYGMSDMLLFACVLCVGSHSSLIYLGIFIGS